MNVNMSFNPNEGQKTRIYNNNEDEKFKENPKVSFT